MTHATHLQPSQDDWILKVDNLKQHFPIRRGVFQRVVGHVHAVDGVSFSVRRGETLGLVGESGCGKTTTGRSILQLYKPTDGHVYFNGQDLTRLPRPEMRKLRSKIQMIFQDPYSSLDPRMTIEEIIAEGLPAKGYASRADNRERVKDLMKLVNLSPNYIDRYAHEFSGGQRQRIGVARALAVKPELIICDEPISALDVSVQAQVVNLLMDLQKDLGLTYLFIAHDLSMVRHISDRVAVMYLGLIVELASSKVLYEKPMHPYTQVLMSAVPVPDPVVEKSRKRIILEGDVPSPVNQPGGCYFHPRCPMAKPICAQKRPDWREIEHDHWVACHFA
ncbi:MAG: ATP-binding cassette domain-containing protein [Anaerolineae bacterium]|jgi:oligopeptide transport system ATP-binding protein|nr:ATP-binding cassette domain-containing protein [Anaerolineae bacterium]